MTVSVSPGRRYGVGLHLVLCLMCASVATAGTPLGTTINDFFQPGTQPNSIEVPIAPAPAACSFCHGIFEEDNTRIWKEWQGSMMAQAARDPLFYACLAIANQDAPQSGDLCIRCHSPKAWLEGRSIPTDASAFIPEDRDSVTCFLCHRMVDPVYDAETSPVEDVPILLGFPDEDPPVPPYVSPAPTNPHSANYVVDPLFQPQPPDLTGLGPRRSTFPNPFQGYPEAEEIHPFIVSPFHGRSELCATCHDVSNPILVRQADGTYLPGEFDAPHPTQDKYQMFPLERTYSEWANSAFPNGVDTGGLFGGNLTVVRTCQDCHMPDSSTVACNLAEGTPRDDVPAHEFNGGNAWVQSLVITLFPEDFMMPGAVENLEAGMARAVSMLQRASLLSVTSSGSAITARVTNRTGHKLPSGYGEGRRMWLNVQFFDAGDELIAERGHYDSTTGDLTAADTKVYESKHGIDAAMAALTGQSVGESFHFILNNMIVKDNRIPPMGFTNAAFEAIQAEPVGAVYADGQNWDESVFEIPRSATSVTVTLYYQTASKEYVTFLRDENTTPGNDWGNTLYELWDMNGKSPPVMMASQTISLVANGDGDHDGDVDLADHAALAACLTGPDAGPPGAACGPFDFNADDDVDLLDVSEFQSGFDP